MSISDINRVFEEAEDAPLERIQKSKFFKKRSNSSESFMACNIDEKNAIKMNYKNVSSFHIVNAVSSVCLQLIYFSYFYLM